MEKNGFYDFLSRIFDKIEFSVLELSSKRGTDMGGAKEPKQTKPTGS